MSGVLIFKRWQDACAKLAEVIRDAQFPGPVYTRRPHAVHYLELLDGASHATMQSWHRHILQVQKAAADQDRTLKDWLVVAVAISPAGETYEPIGCELTGDGESDKSKLVELARLMGELISACKPLTNGAGQP